MGVEIVEIAVADRPEAWAGCGFTVDGDSALLGGVRLRFVGPDAGRGIVSWTLAGAANPELDGLPTTLGERRERVGQPPEHPNGALRIDHVVAFSPDLDRTVAALEAAGLDLRRRREGPTPGGATRQAFFRLGEEILEVVEAPEGTKIRSDPSGPARLWGLALLADDLERPAEAMGDRLGEARDAVQPGRRIAPARREAGLGPAVAFITPARDASRP